MSTLDHGLRAAAGLVLAAGLLAGCATTPPKVAAPAAPPPPAPPPAAPAVVTMAPIPNPTATAHERHASSRSHSGASSSKRAHANEASSAAAQQLRPAVDPKLAAQLRARGLEELDRGAVSRAVALLTRASTVDPNNSLIQHDLARAERIAQAVHEK